MQVNTTQSEQTSDKTDWLIITHAWLYTHTHVMIEKIYCLHNLTDLRSTSEQMGFFSACVNNIEKKVLNVPSVG